MDVTVGATLRKIALSKTSRSIPSEAQYDCACKLRDIAKTGGADAHDANMALYDIVMAPELYWDTPEIAQWITEPNLTSDPDFVKHVQEVRKGISDYDNSMIASDSGLYTTG